MSLAPLRSRGQESAYAGLGGSMKCPFLCDSAFPNTANRQVPLIRILKRIIRSATWMKHYWGFAGSFGAGSQDIKGAR